MNFVMFGHRATSARASPTVTSRQLLVPKPSASASVIFLGPHQDGTAAALALAFADALELEPANTSTDTSPAALSAASIPLTLRFIVNSTLSSPLLVGHGRQLRARFTCLGHPRPCSFRRRPGALSSVSGCS